MALNFDNPQRINEAAALNSTTDLAGRLDGLVKCLASAFTY